MPAGDYREACVNALADADFARQLGLQHVPDKVAAGWLSAVDRAMTYNTQSFAWVPMDELLSNDGLLVRLEAAGYTVQAPDRFDEIRPVQ